MIGHFPNDYNFDFPKVDRYMGVAGVSFFDIDNKAPLLSVGDDVLLFRDYKNKFSKTAIGVKGLINNQWEQIGFIPDEISKIIACEMDANIPWVGKIIRISTGWDYPKYGVSIMIWVKSESEDT